MPDGPYLRITNALSQFSIDFKLLDKSEFSGQIIAGERPPNSEPREAGRKHNSPEWSREAGSGVTLGINHKRNWSPTKRS